MQVNYFLSRKSCRNFKAQEVPYSLLESIIERAMKAPTCGNMQLYSVIVTRDKENLKKLAAFHFNQPASTTAPCILTVCADFNRFTRWCETKKADAGFNNFHSFITALTDAVIFAQQIVTVAELEGLGSCYLGTVTYNAKEISELLNCPEMVVPVAAIALGFPRSAGEDTDRLPIKGILHQEKYNHFSNNDIEEIFRIHAANPDNQKFIEENGKENLAQVFAEVRYPREMNESVSKSFYDLLKEKGFLPDGTGSQI